MSAIVNRGKLPIKSLLGALALCLGAGAVMPAHALDLTASGNSGFVNDGVFFQQTSGTGSGGTGNLNPFLRIQAGGSEQGFNSDARPEEFDEDSNAALNRDFLLSEIPIVTLPDVNGVLIEYGEILLDLNEPNNNAAAPIDLTALRIFQHAIDDIVDGPDDGIFNGFAGQSVTEIFTLGQTVNLNDLESGSGDIDYTINIPVSLFDLTNGAGVTIFAAFNNTSGGFEEFAVATGDNLETIPTPAMLPALLGLGITAIRKRKQHKPEQEA